ncbi:MAG: phenazine-specific anthranilate synthase component I, partial [Pseudobdellovibrionaceae bacterium]
GPGPGDPRDSSDPKISHIQRLAAELLAQDKLKFYGICLGHQILSHMLGFTLEKLPLPRQGVQEKINLFGEETDLAFYNTFAARAPESPPSWLDIASGEDGFIHAIRGEMFGSIQGHPESVLSKDGYTLLYRELSRLLVD